MPPSSPSQRLALLVLVGSLGGCTGCSLLGYGIGSAIPRWDHDVPPARLESYRKGREPLAVDVEVQSSADEAPWRMAGSCTGQDAENLVVVTHGGTHTIPLRDVRRVDVRTGSAWVVGLVFGAVVDTALVAAFVVAMATFKPTISTGRW